MVLLKCNIALAFQYFSRILILDALLLTSTCINSMKVEAESRTQLVKLNHLGEILVCRSSD